MLILCSVSRIWIGGGRIPFERRRPSGVEEDESSVVCEVMTIGDPDDLSFPLFRSRPAVVIRRSLQSDTGISPLSDEEGP